jgi:hypothetical protein
MIACRYPFRHQLLSRAPGIAREAAGTPLPVMGGGEEGRPSDQAHLRRLRSWPFRPYSIGCVSGAPTVPQLAAYCPIVSDLANAFEPATNGARPRSQVPAEQEKTAMQKLIGWPYRRRSRFRVECARIKRPAAVPGLPVFSPAALPNTLIGKAYWLLDCGRLLGL